MAYARRKLKMISLQVMLEVLSNFNGMLRLTKRVIYVYQKFQRLQTKDLISYPLEMFSLPSFSVYIRKIFHVKEIGIAVKVTQLENLPL